MTTTLKTNMMKLVSDKSGFCGECTGSGCKICSGTGNVVVGLAWDTIKNNWILNKRIVPGKELSYIEARDLFITALCIHYGMKRLAVKLSPLFIEEDAKAFHEYINKWMNYEKSNHSR